MGISAQIHKQDLTRSVLFLIPSFGNHNIYVSIPAYDILPPVLTAWLVIPGILLEMKLKLVKIK